MQRFLVFWLLRLGVAGLGFAQLAMAHGQSSSPGNEMEARFQQILEEEQQQPLELLQSSRRLRESANGDCETLQVAWALELYAAAVGYGDPSIDSCLNEVLSCVEPYTRMHWYAAFLLYQRGELERALGQTNLALLDDLVKGEALDARGGLHALLGRYDLAVKDFEALVALGDGEAPPSVYVNLSGIHIVAQNWAEALRWTSTGLEVMKFKKGSLAPSSPQYLQLSEVETALLANQMTASMRLGDEDLAHSTWQRMNIMDIEKEKLTNVNSVLTYALLDDRRHIYDFIREKGEVRWSEMNPNAWGQLGGLQLLLRPMWRPYFFTDTELLSPADSVRRQWLVMRTLWEPTEAQRLWSIGKHDSEAWPTADTIIWVLFVIFGIVLVFSSYRWWKGRKRLSLNTLDSTQWGLLEIIEDIESLGPRGDFDFQLEKLNGHFMEKRRGMKWNGLTEIENEVLLAMLGGMGSKEIASATNRSPASIYNIRSRIRQKLDVPDGMSLDEWCAQMNSTP